MKSLEEVSKIVGLSRRTIQEYEKAGVIPKPSHRTKRGYLRYDDQDITRLFQVRFYRELGYEAKDILEIFAAPNFDRQNAIALQISDMKKKKERLEDLITVAETLRDHNIPPEALSCAVPRIKNVPFDVALSAFSGGLRTIQTSEDPEQIHDEEEELDDKEVEQWFGLMEKTLELVSCGYPVQSKAVQSRIGMLHHRMSRSTSPSIFVFWGLWQLFRPEAELGHILDDIYGPGSAKILYEAVQLYFHHHMEEIDNSVYLKIVDEIECLHRKHLHADSRSVQEQVQKLLNILYEETGVSPAEYQKLNGIWKREAFQSWDVPNRDKEQLVFLAQAIEAYKEEKRDSK